MARRTAGLAAAPRATRRQFLGTTAGLAAACWAAACGDDPAVGVAPDAAAPAADVPPIADLPPASDVPATADFTALAKHLTGAVLRPGDPGFAAAAQTFHTRFDAIVPRAIAQCASAADVQTAVQWAVAAQVPLRIRAGGHSYGGFCTDPTALVVDVRALNTVQLDVANRRLTIGAGALVIDAQAALWSSDLALMTASCPTVGMAGLTLGGGYGLLSRQFGLTCDALVAVDIVLASGVLQHCTANANPTLFWACRGGGGGNFGVVTALTYALAPAGQTTTFSQTWAWTDAAAVLAAWQQWAPTTAPALTASCQLFAGGNGGAAPTISVGGAFLGTPDALTPLLAQLQALGAPPPLTHDVATGTYGQMAPALLDCDGVVAHCHLIGRSPAGQVPRGTYLAKSDYVKQLLPPAALTTLVAALDARAPSDQVAGIILDPYGGALATPAADATAFVHRDALFCCQYLAFGQPGSALTAEQTWLLATWQALRPFVSGQAYVNYIDPELAGWRAAYYGGNVAQLQAVKAAVDPGRVFDFAQAV